MSVDTSLKMTTYVSQLIVAQRRQKEKVAEARLVDDDDEYQVRNYSFFYFAFVTGFYESENLFLRRW